MFGTQYKVCLSSNLYYSLLGFFFWLPICLLASYSDVLPSVPVCLFCLSVWENDRMGFCLLFESIFILLSTSSNKSGGNSTRPHGALKICPKRVLSTCHVDNDNVSSAVWVPSLDAVSIFLCDCIFDFFGRPAFAHFEPTCWNLQWYIFFNICVPFPFQNKGNWKCLLTSTNVSALRLDFADVSAILQALHTRALLSRSCGEMKLDSISW